MSAYDVIVVGAGPGRQRHRHPPRRAGLVGAAPRQGGAFPGRRSAASISLRKRRASSTVWAPSRSVDAAGARPLRGMRIVAPDGTRLEGRYPTAGHWRGYRDHALAVPREILDRILLERARGLTADARERHRVTGLRMDGGRVAGVQAEDPAGPALRGGRPPGGGRGRPRLGGGPRAGARAPASPAADGARPGRGGLADLDDMGEIYVDPPDYSILNPVAVRSREPEPGGAAGACPAVSRAARRLLRARGSSSSATWPRASPDCARPVRSWPWARWPIGWPSPRVDGVALVGDAAGFYDPFTGEGLYTALRGAELLAEVAHDALRAGRVLACRARALRARAPRGLPRQGAAHARAAGADLPPAPRQRRRARPRAHVPRGSTRCWACSATSSPAGALLRPSV